MLDEATVLQITSASSLNSVQVCTCEYSVACEASNLQYFLYQTPWMYYTLLSNSRCTIGSEQNKCCPKIIATTLKVKNLEQCFHHGEWWQVGRGLGMKLAAQTTNHMTEFIFFVAYSSMYVFCVFSLLPPQKLCLHDNHLARFHLASSLRQLTRLLLSFNELTSAEDIQHLVCG